MRRAEWQRRAADPKSLFGWWWRSIERRRSLLLALPVVIGIVTGLSLAGLSGGWLLVVGTALLLIGSQVPPRVEGLRELLPVPPASDQAVAAVAYRKRRLILGRDVMVLTLVEGWLYAEGIPSSFALRPEDVYRLRSASRGEVSLALRDGEEIRLGELRSGFRQQLEGWHRPVRWMEGEPTFPPGAFHPEEFARWSFWASIGLIVLSVPAVVKALIIHRLPAEISIAVSVTGFTLARFAWRQMNLLGERSIKASGLRSSASESTCEVRAMVQRDEQVSG